MTSSITDEVKELKSIMDELKRVNLTAKNLRLRKKELEASIIKYLDDQKQPGVRIGDFCVLAEKKEKRERKKKAEKLSDGEAILSQYGVAEPSKVLVELMESMKGNKNSVQCLKAKEIKL
jgi:hypothetical protein